MVEARARVSAASTAAADETAIRWQFGRRRFALHSPSGEILELARVVLNHGPGGHASEPVDPGGSWHVAADPVSATAWRVRGPAGDLGSSYATAEAAVRAVEFAALLELLTEDPLPISLHAALLGRGRAGVLIVGPSESGKSTLAAALWLQGLAFCGDDVALVADDAATLSAVPRRVSLRHGSRRLLGDPLWQRIAATPSFLATEEGCLFHPHELGGPSIPAEGLTPTAIVFLARRGVKVGPGQLSPIPAAQALLALASYSNLVRTVGMGAALERLQPLVARTPAHDLGRGPLPAMIAAVEQLLGAGPFPP